MISSINQKFQDASRWVGKQVTGGDDFGQPRSKTADYALIGAAGGAVAGATIGAVTGFQSQAEAGIEEVWVNRNITHPEMNGYRHNVTPDLRTVCHARDENYNCTSSSTEVQGFHHSYSPNIHHRVVGQYTEPTFQHTQGWEPLRGAFLGAAGGAVVGLAVGVGAAALQRAITADKPEPPPAKLSPETKDAMETRAAAAALGGTVVGAGIGTYLGIRAGQAEIAGQQVHTRTWNIPVTERQTLGHIPSNYYEYNWSGLPVSFSGGNRAETVPVNRDIPVYNGAGQPRVTGTQKTFETGRYGPVFAGITGGVIGAGVGLAAGVAVGVTDKMLTQRKAARESAQAEPPAPSAPPKGEGEKKALEPHTIAV